MFCQNALMQSHLSSLSCNSIGLYSPKCYCRSSHTSAQFIQLKPGYFLKIHYFLTILFIYYQVNMIEFNINLKKTPKKQ